MPVAIDSSVLVAAEKGGGIQSLLPPDDPGPYYIPAHAAAEFLVGTHPPVRADLRQRAAQLYTQHTRVSGDGGAVHGGGRSATRVIDR